MQLQGQVSQAMTTAPGVSGSIAGANQLNGISQQTELEQELNRLYGALSYLDDLTQRTYQLTMPFRGSYPEAVAEGSTKQPSRSTPLASQLQGVSDHMQKIIGLLETTNKGLSV